MVFGSSADIVVPASTTEKPPSTQGRNQVYATPTSATSQSGPTQEAGSPEAEGHGALNKISAVIGCRVEFWATVVKSPEFTIESGPCVLF